MEKVSELITKRNLLAAKKIEIEEKKNEIKNYDLEISDSDHIEYLNDLYAEVEICGYTYGAGYALLRIDETAFNQSRFTRSDEERESSEGYKKLEEELEELENEEYDLEEEIEELEELGLDEENE